jgi:hypothetical protein
MPRRHSRTPVCREVVEQALLPNAAYFLRRELCSRVSDTDLCRKPGQNPIPEGKIGPKANEFLRRLRLHRRGLGHCMITVAKSMRHWALLPAASTLMSTLSRDAPSFPEREPALRVVSSGRSLYVLPRNAARLKNRQRNSEDASPPRPRLHRLWWPAGPWGAELWNR